MSILKVSGLKDLSGNTIQSVAQIVSTQKTDSWYSSTTLWTDIPGMSVVITPTAASSKILVLVSIQFTTSGHAGIRLYRNQNPIAFGNPTGNRTFAFDWYYGTSSYNTAGYPRTNKGGHWLDSPNTTSAIEYKVQYAAPYSSSYYIGVNYNPYDNSNATWNASTVSTIHAVEFLQ